MTMKTKSEIIEILKTPAAGAYMANETVDYNLVDAEVVFRKTYMSMVRVRGIAVTGTKIIVKDPVLGSVYFQSTSDKIRAVGVGDKISLSLTLTGVGTPSEKYPDPIIFAKANTRKRDSVGIKTTTTEPSAHDDISVNL